MATAVKEKTGLTCSLDELKNCLKKVFDAVGCRALPSAMQSVLVGDGMVSATNRELRIDYDFPDFHGEPILLPYNRLRAIADNSPSDLTITKTANGCTIKSTRSKWEIPTENASEFPDWRPDARTIVCKMPADQFRRAVDAVKYAIDSGSSRYALGGVLIEVSRADGKIWFVGTDGRRLSRVEIPLGDMQDPDDCSIIVPPTALATICKLASKDGGVELYHNGSELVATIDEKHTVTSVLVSGNFPKWRDVFHEPKIEPHYVSRMALLAATKAAAIVTSEQSKGVCYDFGDSLTLTAKSSEYGESKVQCKIEKNGSQCKVKLDPAFVCDFLVGLPEDEPTVTIHTTGPDAAVTLTCNEYRGVIMPLAQDA